MTRSTRPLIHFAHATGMPVPVYRTLLDNLAQDYDIITVSTLGIDQRYPIDAHWKSLSHQVIDSIVTQAHGRKVIAIGHSLGSVLTLLASYQRPELFVQSILLDPPLILGKASLQLHYAKWFNRELLDKVTPAHLSVRRREHWESREQAGEMLRPKGFYKDFDERCFADYLQYALQDDPVRGGVTLTIPREAEVAIFRNNPSWWWLKQPKPRVPTQLIMGKDSIFVKRGFPEIAKRDFSIPYQLTDGGHMFPLEHPDHVAGLIRQAIQAQLDGK